MTRRKDIVAQHFQLDLHDLIALVSMRLCGYNGSTSYSLCFFKQAYFHMKFVHKYNKFLCSPACSTLCLSVVLMRIDRRCEIHEKVIGKICSKNFASYMVLCARDKQILLYCQINKVENRNNCNMTENAHRIFAKAFSVECHCSVTALCWEVCHLSRILL